MNRRSLLWALAAGGGVSRTAGVCSQPAGRGLPRVAYLGTLSPTAIDQRMISGFKRGLVENGLLDGSTIAVDYNWTEGSQERLTQICADLAKSGVAVIVTEGPQTVRALLAAGVRQPIVLAISGDPVADGSAASLAHPGGTVTGLSMSNTELEAKRLELLKEVVPSLKRVLVLRDPSVNIRGLASARSAASALGIELLLVETRDPGTFNAAFAEAVLQGADGLSVMTSPLFYFNRTPLIELATRHRLPSVWENSTLVREGGLLSYGPSFADMYRRSADYVARILKGAKPADLPIEQPTLFELTINVKTAKALDLTIPPSILARADEVIE